MRTVTKVRLDECRGSALQGGGCGDERHDSGEGVEECGHILLYGSDNIELFA